MSIPAEIFFLAPMKKPALGGLGFVHQSGKGGAVSSSAPGKGCRQLSAEPGVKGRNEKAAPGKVPARPGPFGVVPSRTPQCNKCAADVKRPLRSRGAACAGLLPSQGGGGNLSKVARVEKPAGEGLVHDLFRRRRSSIRSSQWWRCSAASSGVMSSSIS